jgi:hypothetical protein
MAVDDTPKEADREMVIYDFDPNNLPPEYLRAVGLVAMASAQTESVVGDFIGCLLGIDNIETLALTTHMAGPLKDHVARALIEMKTNSSNVVDDVDDLLDAIDEAMKRRNVVVHNPLIIHPKTKEVLSHRLKARGSLRLELRPISVKEIEEDARLIHEVGMALVGFMMDRGLEPITRTKPLMEYLDRGKKAREVRRAVRNGKGAAPAA